MTELSIEQAVQIAMHQYRTGNLTEAEALFRKLLSLAPENAENHFNFGLVLLQPGRLQEAADAFGRAIAIKPDFAQAHAYLGSVLRELGRLNEALVACTRAVQLKPDFAEAYVEIGNILGDLNQLNEAVAAFRHAINFRPEMAVAHNNLGDALRRTGRFGEALAACKRAIELNPDFAEAHNNLGIILRATKDYPAAFAEFAKTIQLSPQSAAAHNNMGNVLLELDRADEALVEFDRALAINRNSAEFHCNRGLALASLGSSEQAISAHDRALKLDPYLTMAYTCLAQTLKDLLRFDEAAAIWHKAVSVNPDNPMNHWNLALTLLGNGNFAQGWEEYEWGIRGTWKSLGLKFSSPPWNGEDLRDKTLLLHDEAGYGDTLQFVRYAALLNGLGARLLLQCKSPLVPLLAELPAIEAIFAADQIVPHYDFHVALQSLPRLFKTDLTNIPNAVPYLKAPAKYLDRWRPRMQGDGLKVGLVWSGASHSRLASKGQLRSADLFAAISQVSDMQYYSLQKGPAARESRPQGLNLIDFGEDLHDFADTAAVIEQLDLVISIDTSVVHLAGALAIPVWVLLSHDTDFRWLRDRADSPWYPTARLFRQTIPNDYSGPLSGIAAALKNGDFQHMASVP